MEKRPKRSTTMRRHELVFINYLRVLKRLGADAKNVSKIALYDEAGQPLGARCNDFWQDYKGRPEKEYGL